MDTLKKIKEIEKKIKEMKEGISYSLLNLHLFELNDYKNLFNILKELKINFNKKAYDLYVNDSNSFLRFIKLKFFTSQNILNKLKELKSKTKEENDLIIEKELNKINYLIENRKKATNVTDKKLNSKTYFLDVSENIKNKYNVEEVLKLLEEVDFNENQKNILLNHLKDVKNDNKIFDNDLTDKKLDDKYKYICKVLNFYLYKEVYLENKNWQKLANLRLMFVINIIQYKKIMVEDLVTITYPLKYWFSALELIQSCIYVYEYKKKDLHLNDFSVTMFEIKLVDRSPFSNNGIHSNILEDNILRYSDYTDKDINNLLESLYNNILLKLDIEEYKNNLECNYLTLEEEIENELFFIYQKEINNSLNNIHLIFQQIELYKNNNELLNKLNNNKKELISLLIQKTEYFKELEKILNFYKDEIKGFLNKTLNKDEEREFKRMFLKFRNEKLQDFIELSKDLKKQIKEN